MRREWNLAGKFVLGYSGNLGRAHEYDTLLAAAERLRDDARFIFLMIGGGKRFDELAAAVKRRRLDSSFRFMPYQERPMLPYSLSVPDAHWLSLNPKPRRPDRSEQALRDCRGGQTGHFHRR